MRILLVEDHPPLAEVVSDALRRAGFAVDHARTAADARDIARVGAHSLVLLDLGLPDGDGLTLLPHLRAGGRVPVIVSTARRARRGRRRTRPLEPRRERHSPRRPRLGRAYCRSRYRDPRP